MNHYLPQASEKVRISSLHTASADYSDDTIDSVVRESLLQFRDDFFMDVVFVSEFVNGRRVFRFIDTPIDMPVIGVGDSDTLEESWCKYIVEGTVPQFIPDGKKAAIKYNLTNPSFNIGTHLSIPVILEGGSVYGTLCCFSFSINGEVEESDLINLRDIAKLISQRIDLKNKMKTIDGKALGFAD